MDLDEINVINLHYKMLEYIFKLRGVNSSCFGHFWDKFRSENKEFQHLSSGHLKKIFWEQVLPNIDTYELLGDDLKDYFKQENFLNVEEGTFETVRKNEPKGDGRDFLLVYPNLSEDEDGTDDQNQESLSAIFKNKFTYMGSFLGSDTDSDRDECCVVIKTGNPSSADETNDVIRSVIKPFKLLLRDEYEKTKDCEEIVAGLEDSSVAAGIECFAAFPRGLQDYLSQFDFFRDQLGDQSVNDKEDSAMETNDSELDVPCTSSQEEAGSLSVNEPSTMPSSLTSLRESLGDVTNSPKRTLRSNSRTSIQTEKSASETSLKSSSSRKVRTKPLIVHKPAVNARMETFAAAFKSTKRRRITRSQNLP